MCVCVCVCVFKHKKTHMHHHHHPHNHHHVAPAAWIFLILSRHPSVSSIAPGRSSRLHHVSAQTCCM